MGGHTSAFTYGADGLRRSSQVDSGAMTRYAYDGTTMVREMRNNAQGALTAAATYLIGPRGVEYRRDDGSGVVKWYVYDGMGSVTGELDPSGNLTAGKKYDVYGAERSGGTGTATTRQGFCGSLGHVADAETGLIYMRARYYDPNVGRFVSEDPAGSGPNWFAYCLDDPENNVDETGKSAEHLIEWWVDRAGDSLFATGLAWIIGGKALIDEGAGTIAEGEEEELEGDAQSGPTLSSMIVGLMKKLEGDLHEMEGAEMCHLGADRIAAGIGMIIMSQYILGCADDISESIASGHNPLSFLDHN